METVSIKPFGSSFIITRPGEDTPHPEFTKLYNEERGAKQAVSKHKSKNFTYKNTPAPKAEPAKAKAKAPAPKAHTVTEVFGHPLDTLNALREKGMILVRAAPKVVGKRDLDSAKKRAKENPEKETEIMAGLKRKPDWSAGDQVCAHISDDDGKTVTFGRLLSLLKSVNYKNLTDAEREAKREQQAEYKAKREARVVKREAVKAEREAKVEAVKAEHPAPAKPELSESERQLRNSVCKVNGFPRWRELQHAAAKPEHPRHDEAIAVMGIVAATMEAATAPNRAQLDKPYAKFG